ncbi:MAG: response regulator [Patescibacteria group bacterium]
MKKILFIEDEPNLQKAVGEILKQEGYEILGAFDGAQGIELAKKEKPDMILLDLILPKKDGFEVLKEIKADDELKDTPVIILTNLEGSGDVEKALNLGATTYLVKANYELDDIVSKIKEFLK